MTKSKHQSFAEPGIEPATPFFLVNSLPTVTGTARLGKKGVRENSKSQVAGRDEAQN